MKQWKNILSRISYHELLLFASFYEYHGATPTGINLIDIPLPIKIKVLWFRCLAWTVSVTVEAIQ